MELKAEEEERANRPPPVKKQFSIVLADNEGVLEDKDLTGWVVQIPEDDSVTVAPERIIRAAYEYNTTPKGRRMPVQTIGEACEAVTAKLFKEQNVWVKTKVTVLAEAALNQNPTEPVEKPSRSCASLSRESPCCKPRQVNKERSTSEHATMW